MDCEPRFEVDLTADLPKQPPGGGYLPHFLLLVGITATYNSIQNYFITWQTKEVYQGKADERESSSVLRTSPS